MSAHSPAYPSALGRAERGISVRAYFAAHAPPAPQGWPSLLGESALEREVRWRSEYSEAMCAWLLTTEESTL